MKIEMIDVNSLVEYDLNAKKHPQSQIKGLAESITRFGFIQPVVVDANNVIVIGHGRVRAAAKIGMKEVPCLRIENLNEDQIKQLRIVDNKIAETGFDDVLLVQDLKCIDAGFEGFNIDFEDIKIMLDDNQHENIEEDDDFEANASEIKTDIVIGDLFEIGEHRLLCGDSTDKDQVARLMNGQKADMVFTDPPYNVKFNGRSGKFDVIENDDLPEKEFEQFIDGFVSILNWLNPANYYVWCNWKFYGILQKKLEFKACIVWAKNVFGLGRGYRHQHEFCLFNGKLDEGINNESDLWDIKKDTNYVHPTQKPIALALRALQNHNKDKNIVDLFSGSGSTMLAAHHLKRRCYGMELDPKYCQIIIDRMIKNDSNLIVKKNGELYKLND